MQPACRMTPSWRSGSTPLCATSVLGPRNPDHPEQGNQRSPLLSRSNGRLQRSHRLRRSREQILRPLPVLQDLRIDASLLVGVQTEARQVLQAQVAVAVQLGIDQPGAELWTLRGKTTEQVDGRIKPDLRQ